MPLRFSLRRMLRRDESEAAGPARIPRPGDRFVERGGPQMLWEVERILAPRGGLPGHVVLRDPGRQRPRRLVAQAALGEGGRFAPAEESARAEGATAA